jgi:2,4-dienoyl-CoA reductase-like NADH-dependent reductase (Old Yellow Enzyme family)/thioredoxin reductase
MTTPFDTIQIGSLQLSNRLAMAPIKTAFGTTSGQVTEQLIAYFARRAEGGVGLIISEPLYVDKAGQEHPKQLGIDADDKIEGLHDLVQAVHGKGAKIFAHLNHGGRAANPKATGRPPEAPSNVPCPRTGIEPEVLSENRIIEIIQAFGTAARRAQEAGFDGVELQFGLGYLISQFLSPATNLRSDGYGGDYECRSRLAREVFASVRFAVGERYPIAMRISASEKTENGLDIEDAINLSQTFATLGVDLIHVATGSNCDSLPWYFQHMALPKGVNEALADQIKKGVQIPVMAAGRLGDPARIRVVIGSGMLDMVALGRPLIADPDLPRKMRDNKDDEVQLCGHCLQRCFGNVSTGKGIGCHFNPRTGHELEEKPESLVSKPKRVVVVGGGPAGMQSALTARRRGHQVTLFEKEKLGGQFLLASLPPSKARIEKPLSSLIRQVERAGIDIRFEEATRSRIESLAPEIIVLATGARPTMPPVKGLGDSLTPAEALTGTRDTGNRVLILGGGMVGMEVAEMLAKNGKQVAVIEILEEVASDMDRVSRKMMFNRLASLPVEIHTATELMLLEDKRALVSHHGEKRDLGEFDSIVVTSGNQPFDSLSKELADTTIEIHVIGDAKTVGNVGNAIKSGHDIGMSL